MTSLQKRLLALELSRGIGRRAGGVVHFDHLNESAVGAAARLPPGSYIMIPKPPENIEAWEALVAREQEQLLANAALHAAGRISL
jgi:hypothetical protein